MLHHELKCSVPDDLFTRMSLSFFFKSGILESRAGKNGPSCLCVSRLNDDAWRRSACWFSDLSCCYSCNQWLSCFSQWNHQSSVCYLVNSTFLCSFLSLYSFAAYCYFHFALNQFHPELIKLDRRKKLGSTFKVRETEWSSLCLHSSLRWTMAHRPGVQANFFFFFFTRSSVAPSWKF